MQKERNSKEPIARKKMSVASSSSFSCIKLGISLPQSSSSSSLSSSGFRFSTSKCTAFTIRCSDGSNLRKPLAPSPPNPPTVAKPVPPSSPPPPSSPSSSSSSSSSPAGSTPPKPVAVADDAAKKGNITLEFQRQKAKELQEYFKQKKLDEADQGPFFGFIGKNEISNGRWAMFGFAVGMLTEYATGSDFVQQVQILLSNFGILDLE